jgi:hypothetical protein
VRFIPVWGDKDPLAVLPLLPGDFPLQCAGVAYGDKALAKFDIARREMLDLHDALGSIASGQSGKLYGTLPDRDHGGSPSRTEAIAVVLALKVLHEFPLPLRAWRASRMYSIERRPSPAPPSSSGVRLEFRKQNVQDV